MAKKKSATKYSVSQTERILPPEGLHNARVVRFVELGTQDTDWGEKFKCQISFELVDESAVFNDEVGEQNFVMHRTYNRSLGSGSDMGKAVRAILGKDYVNQVDELEMDEILDQPCKVMVEYSDDEEYANIIKVFPWKKSDGKCAKAESEIVSLYLDDNFDQDVFDSLPEWMQDMIANSPEGEELELESAKPKSKKGKGKAKPSKKKVRDDDDDEEEEEEDDEPKSKRKSKKKDDDDEEEDEEDAKPKSRRGRKADEDDEDEEDDEDDKPTKQRTSRKTAAKKTGRRR